MKKIIYSLIILIVISGCSLFESQVILEDVFAIRGFVFNIYEEPLESVNIKIISIDATEDHESLSDVGDEYFNDINGEYSISVVCNTTWTNSTFSKDKNYINYINSIKLEFSKDGYNTQIKEFVATEIENNNFDEDVILTTND